MSFINPKIFRAYDIRGHVNDLTPEVVIAIAQALCAYYQQQQQHQIVIGYDARHYSLDYAKIMYYIFQEAGFTVKLIGQCSTPMMYFSAQSYGGNGIMVTASHNPKHDNGIKWIAKTHPPTPEQIQWVGQHAHHIFSTLPPNTLFKINQLPYPPAHFDHFYKSYQHYIQQDIQLPSSFKIVLDGLHGSAGHIAQRLLKAFNCEIISLRCQANGDFPDHAPDPSVNAHVQQLKQRVLSTHADLGIALDGDGDRLVLIDELGNIINADQCLCLFAELCLAHHPHHQIVYDVKCSTMVKHAILKHHGIPTMIRTGSSFLRQYLQDAQGHAVFAGEFSGHYAFFDGRGLGYDDAIYAALRVLEYLSQTQQTLSQVLYNYPKRFSSEDCYIPMYNYHPQHIFKELYDQAVSLQNVDISQIDGLRFDFKDGFIILRASNTADCFTVRFDADSKQRLYEIQHFLAHCLQQNYPEIAQATLKITL